MRNYWDVLPYMELPALQASVSRPAVQDRLGCQLVSTLLEDAKRRCHPVDLFFATHGGAT